jgi:hypothetical protein
MGIETAVAASLIAGGANLIGNKMAATAKGKEVNKANEVAAARTKAGLGYIEPAYDRSMAARQQQYEQAIGLQGQSFRPSLEAMQGGNVSAQQTLIDSLPMQRAALLGGKVDFSSIKPYQGQINEAAMPGMFNPQAMQFGGQRQPMQQPMQQQSMRGPPPAGMPPLTPEQAAYYGIGG